MLFRYSVVVRAEVVVNRAHCAMSTALCPLALQFMTSLQLPIFRDGPKENNVVTYYITLTDRQPELVEGRCYTMYMLVILCLICLI